VSLRKALNELPYSPQTIACFFGILSYLLRLPFVLRYDLHFGGDSAVWYLMALRVPQGIHPLYFYGQDYEGTLETYLLSFFFKLFGPSIPLGGAVILIEWSVAIGIGVYLLIKGTSRFEGILGGLLASVGVPYTMTYTTVPFSGNSILPLLVMILLLQTYFIIEKGPSPLRILIFGFSVGLGLYLCKKSIIGLAISFLALLLIQTPAWNIRRSLRLDWLFYLVMGALLGKSPDFFGHLHFPRTSHPLVYIASPIMIWNNLKCSLDASLAYFDANAISRIPDGFRFWVITTSKDIHPQSLTDWTFSLLAAFTWLITIYLFLKSHKEKNTSLFLLTGVILVNMLLLTLSAYTNSDFNCARRYFYPAGIPFSLMTGVLFSTFIQRDDPGPFHPFQARYISALSLLGLLLFLAVVESHYYELWKAPDEMKEVRWAIGEMDKNKMNRAMSDWPTNMILTGLTNERIICAEAEPHFVPDYARMVAHANRIIFIQLLKEPNPLTLLCGGTIFKQAGNSEGGDFYKLTPYEPQNPIQP